MFIPTAENYTDMTPTEFEKFSLTLLLNETTGIPNVVFKHNEIIRAPDGNYQIDGTIRYQLMGVNYLTLVECKKYNKAITRDIVQVLKDKVAAAGAQKGILLSTSYFQSGAIKYAKLHGIALIQIIDGRLRYEVRSMNVDYEKIIYPDSLPAFTAILLEQTGESSITSSTINGSHYLTQFLMST